jgi:hypothetical protein
MRGMLFLSICLIFSPALSASNATQTTHIVIPPIEKNAGENNTYYPRVLQLALEKTLDTHGPYTITYHPLELTRNRLIYELERGNTVNVIWAMNNSPRESILHPIKISLMKDLNNYRIFLIRNNDQKRFNKVKSLDDLRLLRAGQGTTWPDTEILNSNQIPVVTAMHYQLLFDMLAANRFDYFPRGLNEIWDEEKIHADKSLTIEQRLMFHYHRPIYFFTSKQNIALANRIEEGLKIAIDDGSFDALFYSYESFRRGEAELLANKRLIFELPDN